MPSFETFHHGTARSWSRRNFLQAAGVAPVALAAAQRAREAVAPADAAPASGQAISGQAVSGLTTEYTATPLGVDAARPRLGWATKTSAPGWSQAGYRVRVASNADLLRQGAADVWDSGQVASAQSADVEYGGGALSPATRYHWAVQVWDTQGRPSGWSVPSWWEMGLLDDADWGGAQWIAPIEPAAPSLAGAHWIWYPEGSPDGPFPAETRYFRGSCPLPAGAQVDTAILVMTADDYYTVYVNGVLTGNPAIVPNGWQIAQTYDISALLHPGANTIAVAATNLQASTSGGLVNTPAGVLGHVHVELAAGVVDVVTDGSWKAAQTVPSGWEQPGFDDSAWAAALDEGAYGGGPWGNAVGVQVQLPAPAMRREFTVTRPVRQARLYISGLGYYVASLNGRRVGDHVLDPAPTVYNKGVLYASYDVTDLVRRGDNAIGVVLGRGFYAINSPNIYWNTAPWLSATPALLVKLDIEQADGTHVTVVSDSDWLTHDSPTLTDSVYNGETYDARTAIDGWDEPGLDTTGWSAPATPPAPAPVVRSQLMPPIRAVDTVQPIAVTSPQPGTFVYKFPSVIAGWPAIAVSGPAGTEVVARYGEVLNADGTVDNQGDPGITPGEIQRDNYILAGSGTEHWEPRFSYGSFQYIQLDGLPEMPPEGGVQARVAHTDVALTGNFSSSDELLNTIHDMTRRTILNNLTGIPTDTPMYEKRGWFGDAQLYTAPAVDNFDMHTFLLNFLNVQADDQGSNGIVGTMALFPALTVNGHADLAYTVATQRTFPSYGYWISLGATTLWEEWQPAPRSHDHAMFGTIDDWFFKYLAGIQPAAPGYQRITVRPYVPSGLSEVDAYQTTPYGKVSVRWHTSGGAFRLSVTIPPNTTAAVSVPAGPAAPVSAPSGAVPLQRVGGYASYRVGAGDYSFTA